MTRHQLVNLTRFDNCLHGNEYGKKSLQIAFYLKLAHTSFIFDIGANAQWGSRHKGPVCKPKVCEWVGHWALGFGAINQIVRTKIPLDERSWRLTHTILSLSAKYFMSWGLKAEFSHWFLHDVIFEQCDSKWNEVQSAFLAKCSAKRKNKFIINEARIIFY